MPDLAKGKAKKKEPSKEDPKTKKGGTPASKKLSDKPKVSDKDVKKDAKIVSATLKAKKPLATKKPTKKQPLLPKKKKVARPRKIKPGAIRFGRAKRAALDKILKRKSESVYSIKKTNVNGAIVISVEKKEKKPQFIIKPIGGEKNGGKRRVLLKKPPSSYPAETLKRKHPGDVHKKKSKQRLRASLKKGTICIILAGVHKGKRVVFLKQLPSGLCLVTGPYSLNGCPLRRINQNYLIATSTKLHLNKVNVPSTVNDDYFKRIKLNKKTKKDDADIFEKKQQKFTTSKKRYATQSLVDKPVVAAVLRHPESRILKRYLHCKFLLQNNNYPHQMKF